MQCPAGEQFAARKNRGEGTRCIDCASQRRKQCARGQGGGMRRAISGAEDYPRKVGSITSEFFESLLVVPAGWYFGVLRAKTSLACNGMLRDTYVK